MIEIRKLAALDIAFLGPVLVIAEFAIGLIGPLALGSFIAVRGHSWEQYLLAAYFAALGVNYIPLFVYSVLLARSGTARVEIADELSVDRRRVMRRYRRGTLLLLLPLFVPALAFAQWRRAQRLEIELRDTTGVERL